MAAAPETVALSNEPSCGTAHSPPPSSMTERPTTDSRSSLKARRNDVLAATTIKFSSSSKAAA